MIQRIQTVYLLIAVILLTFVIFFPIAEFVRTADDVLFNLSIKGLISDSGESIDNFPVYPFSILLFACLIVSVTTIFLFKKRMLQIRFCIFNIVLLVGLQGIMYYYVKFAQAQIVGSTSYGIFFVFPIVCAILVFLALRAIARDEALVRSLDRLR